MKRNLALSTTVLAVMLAACGGHDDDDNNGPPPGASGPQFKMEILSTEDLPDTYGDVGTYEKIRGVFTGEVDPEDSHNTLITDLALAPRNARGMVEYRADFVLFKPKDMGKANGVLRFDVPNRGNLVNPDAYFASRGYVFLNTAWQGDVQPINNRLTLAVPIARQADGSAITGPYRTELLPSVAGNQSLSLPGGTFNSQAMPEVPVSLDTTQTGFALTRRVNQADPKATIPATEWAFAKCSDDSPFPGTPSATDICVKGGVDPSYIYELTYIARDPKVMGLGFAAVRDSVRFFASSQADAQDTANPVAGAIRHTLASGVSQSGNFTKTFINLGFNEGLDGDKVFDGVFAQVAARQNNLNMRFAVPGGGGGVRTDHDAFGQSGVRGLASDYVDELSGHKGGIFARCAASNTCPKLFVGYSGTEFWTLQGSPLLTDALGTRDLTQPDNARVYYYASSHHSPGLPSLPAGTASNKYATNGNLGVVPIVRALYQALENWVVEGETPPDNAVPRLADSTLVAPDKLAFPAIPGVTYTGLINDMHVYDWGPDYNASEESGIVSQLPPTDTGKKYAILVPQVDSDGNDIAGIRSVDIAVPVATETGWNLTNRPGIVDQAGLFGSRFPFAATEAERLANGDPRPSLQARYGDKAGYVAAVRAAADDLVARRFLLQEDADAAVAAAEATTLFD